MITTLMRMPRNVKLMMAVCDNDDDVDGHVVGVGKLDDVASDDDDADNMDGRL